MSTQDWMIPTFRSMRLIYVSGACPGGDADLHGAVCGGLPGGAGGASGRVARDAGPQVYQAASQRCTRAASEEDRTQGYQE